MLSYTGIYNLYSKYPTQLNKNSTGKTNKDTFTMTYNASTSHTTEATVRNPRLRMCSTFPLMIASKHRQITSFRVVSVIWITHQVRTISPRVVWYSYLV